MIGLFVFGILVQAFFVVWGIICVAGGNFQAWWLVAVAGALLVLNVCRFASIIMGLRDLRELQRRLRAIRGGRDE